ncbi:MAG: ATP-binding protein [Oscillospiraceae bacterium]|nr:ATP-binding protein [Oscillospiraceae bacterium]
MKNIIIAGASRAGKTTLAERLNEELNCFVVSLDKIVAAFGRAYPQLDIRLHMDYEKMKDNLAPFIGHFLGVFSDARHVGDDQEFRARKIQGNRFVLEGAAFNFDIISSVLNMYGMEKLNEHFMLIGLVQNKKTADEFVRDFRKYDTEDDWTYEWSDEELRDYAVSRAIPFNREMTELLAKHGFALYDTSTERERVFDKIIEEIKSQIGTIGD